MKMKKIMKKNSKFTRIISPINACWSGIRNTPNNDVVSLFSKELDANEDMNNDMNINHPND